MGQDGIRHHEQNRHLCYADRMVDSNSNGLLYAGSHVENKSHLSHRAPDSVDEVLKVDEAEEGLLFESVQLRSEQVLLVLQYGAWSSTNAGKTHGKCKRVT